MKYLYNARPKSRSRQAANTLLWVAAMIGVSLAIVYGFWICFLAILFDRSLYIILAGSAEMVLFVIYFWLLWKAEC